jgi:hypothetical protein
MSPTSAFDIELDKRKAHIEALPAYELREDLDALERCFHVFNENANELMKHVGEFLQSKLLARQLSDNFVNELVRKLHNYLTSVTSLIDSQRVVMRHRWPVERTNAETCAECKRPLPSSDNLSDFEANHYSKKVAETFETGEAVFMTKLRNYCTHYSIPVPDLNTTWSWGKDMPGMQVVNTLQLDRENLLRWKGWTGPAKAYLKAQPEQFDLLPVVERYVNGAGQFAAWFWDEINARSASLIDEINSKGMELHLWKEANVGVPDWFKSGARSAPPGWNGRLWRAGQRRDRYAHGTRGFRVWCFELDGTIVLEKDDDWTPLPR